MKNVWQYTHWYKSKSQGWTSDFRSAAFGEVERVGLHSCELQNCAETRPNETHCGTAKDYADLRFLAAEFARQAESDSWPP